MKKVVINLLFLFVFFLSFSQDFPSYNTILGIDSHIATDDFGIFLDMETLEYPIEFTETFLKDDYASIDRSQKKINAQNTYKLNKLGLVEEERMKSFWVNIDLTRKFYYDDKGNLTKVQFFEGADPVNEYTSYQYHDNRTIKEISNFAKGNLNKKTFIKLDENTYQWENDKIIITYFIVTTIGKKVRSIKTKYKQTGEEFETKYSYYANSYGLNEKITLQTSSIEKVYTFETNEVNRLSKVVTTDLKTNEKTYSFYTYLNDAYGNWIIKYEQREGGKLGENLDQVKIRQLKYPNGTVTGFNDPNNSEFKKWLQEYHFKNFRKKMSDDEALEGYTWKKNDDGTSYWLTANGKGVADKCVWLYSNDGNAVVYYTEGKQFFLMEGYTTKEANSIHGAKELAVKVTNDGFWFSNGENFFLYDVNGKQYDYNNVFEKFEYDNNGHMIAFKKNGGKLLMEHAKTIQPYIIKPLDNYVNAIDKNNTSNSNSITSKPYEEASDYTWKKDEAGAFWFYKNHETISNIKSFWNGNNLLVLDQTNNSLVNLKGYKLGEPNITYKGYKLNVDFTDGFWFKTDANQFLAYDKNRNHIKDLEINKWAENKQDVIIKSKNSTQAYVLLGYSTAEINKVYSLKLEGYEKNVSNVYDYAAEALKAQTESVVKMAESLDEVYKKVGGECIKGNCVEGYGEKKWPSGIVAEAFFENSKPYGPGLLIYKDGNQKFANFKGSWDDIERFEYKYFIDEGTEFMDAQTKTGFYYNLKTRELWETNLNAKTKILLKPNNDNSCLVGNCQDGVGLYKYGNGAVYLGTFKNGRRHGFGDLRFSNGQYYIGEFVNDRKEGLGTYVWKEDNNYTGQWRSDTYHGKGIMSYSKTNYQAGLWENGKYIRSLDSKSN